MSRVFGGVKKYPHEIIFSWRNLMDFEATVHGSNPHFRKNKREIFKMFHQSSWHPSSIISYVHDRKKTPSCRQGLAWLPSGNATSCGSHSPPHPAAQRYWPAQAGQAAQVGWKIHEIWQKSAYIYITYIVSHRNNMLKIEYVQTYVYMIYIYIYAI